MALDWVVGELIVDSNTTRIAFSAGQTVTTSAWADSVIDPAEYTTKPNNLEIVGSSDAAPAYCGVVPLRRSELPALSGLLRLLVKTADGDSANAADWDSAPTLLESGLIDLSSAVPNEPIWWPMFPAARYGQYLRLYYEVHEELTGAVFYSFVTNQQTSYQRLAFTQLI